MNLAVNTRIFSVSLFTTMATSLFCDDGLSSFPLLVRQRQEVEGFLDLWASRPDPGVRFRDFVELVSDEEESHNRRRSFNPASAAYENGPTFEKHFGHLLGSQLCLLRPDAPTITNGLEGRYVDNTRVRRLLLSDVNDGAREADLCVLSSDPNARGDLGAIWGFVGHLLLNGGFRGEVLRDTSFQVCDDLPEVLPLSGDMSERRQAEHFAPIPATRFLVKPAGVAFDCERSLERHHRSAALLGIVRYITSSREGALVIPNEGRNDSVLKLQRSNSNSGPELTFGDPEPRVEVGSLRPVLSEHCLATWSGRNRGPGGLDPPAQVAQPPLSGALVRLPRVVGQAAGDFQETELPRRGRDLLHALAFGIVRAAERDPRLEPRPRVVAEAGAWEQAGGLQVTASRLRARVGAADRGQVGERVGVERALCACRGHRDRR